MCYKQTILLLTYFGCVLTLTDITTLNCPLDFQVSIANNTITESSLTSFFYSSFQSNNVRVQTIIIDGNTKDLQVYMNELLIPYILISIIAFITFLTLICCCVFDKTCPPCESWRRDLNRRPYEKFELRCVMVFTILFAIGILATSITAFTFTPAIRTNLQYTKCSLYTGLDVALNGDQNNNWGGFTSLSTTVDNISSLVKSAQLQANNYIQNSSDQQLKTQMNHMKQANLDIYKNNKDAGITTPNPSTTATAVTNGDPIPLVKSEFIENNLGPNQTNNTMVNSIDASLQILQKLSSQGYQVIQSANIMVDSTSTIQKNTQGSKQIFKMYLQQLQQVKIDLDKFSSTYFTQILNWGLYIIQGIIGFIIAASLLILFGSISTHFFNILQCRTMVHIGWIIYGITYIGVLALLYVFLSVGSIGNSFCTYYDSMLSSKDQFYKIQESYSQNVLNKLDVCLFENGDILNKFNIAAQMQTVTDLFTNIDIFNDYENTDSINYINKSITSTTINTWISTMSNYRLGKLKDTNDAQTTNDNANYALQQLNLYSNTGGGVPTCSKDRWVFDSSNCTISAQQIYHADSTEQNGKKLSSSFVICISFNENYTTSTATSTVDSGWSQTDYNRRYLQIRQNCSDAYDKIISHGNSLINYRESRNNLFTGIKNQLQNLLTINTKFISILDNFSSRLIQFSNEVSLLRNRVTSKISGLTVSSNCQILSAYMRFTYNVFCINTITNGVNFGICCLVLILLMIAGLITSNIFATRYGRVEYNIKIQQMTDKKQITNNQIFLKRQYSSSQSSSSQQD